MKKIGNIITNNHIIYDKSFNKINEYAKVDNDLPSLYIGLDNAKRNIKDFCILNKKYENDVFWTFKKNERRMDYHSDLDNFYKYCINKIVLDIKYEYINIASMKLSRIISFINYLKRGNINCYYVTPNRRFMFLYDKNNRIVMGVSLALCEYIGIKSDKIISRVNNYYNIKMVDNKFCFTDLIKPYINTNAHYILPLYEYFNN